MAKVSKQNGRLSKGRRVGKKRTTVKARKGDKLSLQIAARLNALLGDRPASYLAQQLGISTDAVSKWLRADRTPDVDKWSDIAKALGGNDFRDLLPQ